MEKRPEPSRTARIITGFVFAAAIVSATGQAAAAKGKLTVDLVSRPSSLDSTEASHLKWQPTANESMLINRMSWTD